MPTEKRNPPFTQRVERHDLGPEASLFVLPAPRLRTFHLLVCFHQTLCEADATRGALLPRVLRRGCRRWPDLASLARHLDRLYGSSFGASASKLGDHQVIELSFSCLGPESLRWVTRALSETGPGRTAKEAGHDGVQAGEDGIIIDGVNLVTDILTHPAGGGSENTLAGGPGGEPLLGTGLREDYFQEEKEGLARDIAALGDDRMTHAHYRCLAEMCRGEPFAVHSMGDLDELQALTAGSLDNFRVQILHSSPFSAYLTGPTDSGVVTRVAEGLSSFLLNVSRGPRTAITPSAAHSRPDRERELFEEADVEQARLVVGLQTGVVYGTGQYPAQTLFNGLLGGFVHSRLFRHIREEAGLAYYAWSRVASTKGLILISCGIEEKNYRQALDLIRRELKTLSRGDFTEAEFDATRNSVLAQARSTLDSPSAMVYGHLEQRAVGVEADEMALWRSLEEVTADQVREFGATPVIDTIYLLGRRAP